MRRILVGLGVLVALIVVGGVILFFTMRHPLPTGGVSGPEADALAHVMERAVGVDQWNKTGAVRFTFDGAGHQHRIGWDRRRNTALVEWHERAHDYRVALDVARSTGQAFVGGRAVGGEEEKQLVDKAMAIFFNDTFWLNPIAKLFDDGVTREKLVVDGKPALLVKYASGGVTPGDAYLWLLDDDKRPRAWRTWVKVLKIPGMQFSWQDWLTLPTGAKVATKHRLAGLFTPVELKDVQAAPSWPSCRATDKTRKPGCSLASLRIGGEFLRLTRDGLSLNAAA